MSVRGVVEALLLPSVSLAHCGARRYTRMLIDVHRRRVAPSRGEMSAGPRSARDGGRRSSPACVAVCVCARVLARVAALVPSRWSVRAAVGPLAGPAIRWRARRTLCHRLVTSVTFRGGVDRVRRRGRGRGGYMRTLM